MAENLIIYASLLGLVLILIVLRLRKKVDFEREKAIYFQRYPEKDNGRFLVNIFVGYLTSQMCRNSADNGVIYKVNDSLSWQYIELTNASYFPVKCDSIIFTDKKYPAVCWIQSTFLRPLFESSTSISQELEAFLNTYNLGVESGEWGAILIREGLPILASEFDCIVEDFGKVKM